MLPKMEPGLWPGRMSMEAAPRSGRLRGARYRAPRVLLFGCGPAGATHVSAPRVAWRRVGVFRLAGPAEGE